MPRLLQSAIPFRLSKMTLSAMLLCLAIGLFGASTCRAFQKAESNVSQTGMAQMHGHMYMTTLRPVQPGDQQRVDAVIEAARKAMEPYRDYHKALADGYRIFLADVPQPQYHFTRYDYGRKAWTYFDPSKPTSLLYEKNPDGEYKLIGAMYTDRVDASEEELNARIPLSIARWHQHINFCQAPIGQESAYFGPNAKFGLKGSIATREACDAVGGQFRPHFFGWMVHVYPYAKDPKSIWSIEDNDHKDDDRKHISMSDMDDMGKSAQDK